jgi:hypothetical protein
MTHEQDGEYWNSVPAAEYIIQLEENVTVLCETHMTAMRLACTAAEVPLTVYKIEPDPENPDEEPVACQACHLAEVKRPKIVLH